MKIFKTIFSAVVITGLLSCSADPGELKVPNVLGEKLTTDADYFTEVKVDILFVIDNSGSMSDFQSKLRDGLSEFTKIFYKNKLLDFHIGVVTSDNSVLKTLGRGGAFVDRKTIDGQEILKGLLNVGTSGGATEKFFNISVDALTPPLVNSSNSGFYRQEAHLAVFFLTDADDQSSYSPEDFVEGLLALKRGRAEKITLVGGVLPVGVACNRSGEPDPEKIEEAILLLEGERLDICEPDFGAELARISNEIFKNISFVPLDVLPDPGTIQIKFGSQIIPNAFGTGWTYNLKENKIYFGADLELKEEPQGTRLQITFNKRVGIVEKEEEK